MLPEITHDSRQQVPRLRGHRGAGPCANYVAIASRGHLSVQAWALDGLGLVEALDGDAGAAGGQDNV